jgi:hypothetical protein
MQTSLMVYIGVDPGAGGGIAVLWPDQVHVETFKMPATERDILDLLERACQHPQRAVLEHVWSTPGQGGAFAFGRSVGHLEMALTAARIPFDKVLPKTWQKALGVVYRKGMTNVEKKNITKRRAQQLFPTLTITHAIADALLMAEYCRRIHGVGNGKEGNPRRAQVHTKAQREEGKGSRAGEGAALARSRAAAGPAHPGDPHQAARRHHRRPGRELRHHQNGVLSREDE